MLKEPEPITKHARNPETKRRWLATGGIFGALLASSCCILPLVLISLGVSGAWIGNFAALDAYKPLFMAVAVVFIAAGFWQVYFKTEKTCDDGEVCERSAPSRLVKITLWTSAALVMLAATIDLWAPLFY